MNIKYLDRSSLQRVWVLATCLQVSLAAVAACPIDSGAQFRQALDSHQKNERYLDTLNCIRLGSDSIDSMTANLNSQEADEFRYAVAHTASDAIEKLGHDRHHKLAANWWESYIANVSPPFDLNRLDFATLKIVQHGRHGEFANRWETVAVGLTHVGRKISPKTAKQLFSVLNRCPKWSASKAPSNSPVCLPDCKPLFLDTVTKLKPQFNPPPKPASTSRDIFDNLVAIERRLACM